MLRKKADLELQIQPEPKQSITASSRGHYRPDIDGMRAVAVVLVILYHLNQSLAPAGFIGVDIFFVISGFVVTRSVLARTSQSPLQAVKEFWIRRFRRIVPALLVMVAFTSVLFALVRPPFPIELYNGAFRTGIAAIFGLGNLYLYRLSNDYFRHDSLNPFIHTWSLGIEEQFYLLFALIFIVTLGLVPPAGVRAKVAILSISCVTACSYAVFVLWASRNTALTYYGTPSRLWEIGIGSILAYTEHLYTRFLSSKTAPLVVSVQALALFGLIFVLWFGVTAPLAMRIMAAVTLAGLLIATGTSKHAFVSRALSAPILVAAGLISYSLYLWHFPILQIWRTDLGLNTPLMGISYLLVVACVATISYRVVELPARRRTVSFSKRLVPYVGVLLVLTITFSFLVQKRPGLLYAGHLHRWRADWYPPNDQPYYGSDRLLQPVCDLTNGSPVPRAVPSTCIAGPNYETGSRPVLLLIGDSHALADWGMALHGVKEGAYTLAALSHDGCRIDESAVRSQSCSEYWSEMPALLESTLRRGDSILISLFWRLKGQAASSALEKIKEISTIACKQRLQVIVEAPLPVFGRPAYLCTPEWFRINYEGCSVRRSEFESSRALVLGQLEKMTQDGLLSVWDPVPLLCSNSACTVLREGKPLFNDNNHLSYFESKSLGSSFVQFWRTRRKQIPI